MKIILPIIVFLIIIIFIIVILNSNIYFSEDFKGSYNQNTIEDLISESYLPFNPYLTENISEYQVIEIYKEVLSRSPTNIEIKDKIYQTKEQLMENLYNSYEYERMIKIQDNLAVSGIENSIARKNLIKKITKIYKDYYIRDPDVRILIPLRDCYIHLRSNIFLFIAVIQSKNFSRFENEVLSTTILTKKLLLEIFNKYYNLLELKLMAEDKIRATKGNVSLSNIKTDINYEKLKDELTKIVANPTINTNLNKVVFDSALLNSSNTTNFLDQLKDFRKSDPLVKPLDTSIYTEKPLATNTNDTNNLKLEDIKKFFSSQVKEVEPFTNKKELTSIDTIYKDTAVGNIFNI
jgi:hypothetical protein